MYAIAPDVMKYRIFENRVLSAAPINSILPGCDVVNVHPNELVIIARKKDAVPGTTADFDILQAKEINLVIYTDDCANIHPIKFPFVGGCALYDREVVSRG
jgi:hypothetical protein